MPVLIDQLNFTLSDLGFLSTVLYLTYGVSKFTSGVLSDRSNPRYFMSIGLICTGLACICFGFSTSILGFAFFWGVNGYFQGWGWAPCAKHLTHWYDQAERGSWWSVWSASHNIGGAVAALLIPLILSYFFEWYWGMLIPGILCVIFGFFLMERLRDVPRTLGLPTIEKFKGHPCGLSEHATRLERMSARKILFSYVLNNKCIWLLALSYFFVYVIRMAIGDWGPTYLVQTKGYNLLDANLGVTWFEMGGLLGMIVAGWGSDYFFKGRRIPIMVFCSLALIVTILIFWKIPPDQPWLDAILFSLIGFFIYGPQMLIGLAAAEFTDTKAAGTATGFVGLTSYLGAAASGYPLGVLAEMGWHYFFIALIVSSVIMGLLLVPIWSAKTYLERKDAGEIVDEDELLESGDPQWQDSSLQEAST